MELSGAEIVVRCLQEEGVDHVFGYPGGAVLYIYDALFQQERVQHILVRHEQAAVHAADAYSRCTQKVGVCLVTSGPGVTNAVTGIATAYMDSIPMVILSGQVPTHAIGEDAFQECDTVGITRPCVKHNFLVKDVKDLATTLKKAFVIAATGRPGPVLVDIPKDITRARCRFEYPAAVPMRSYNPVVKGHQGQIRKAVQLLLQAERPMIYTGGGVILANAADELNTLVDLLGFPCTNTLMGLGGYRASSERFVGMPGMHGTYEANMAMQHCDVLLAVGARFDDRVIGNPKHFAQNPRKIVHIDIDPSSISKRVKVDVPIVGDVRECLVELTSQLQTAFGSGARTSRAVQAWWSQIETWRGKDCLKYDRGNREVIKPQHVIETLWQVTGGDAFVTSDVGQHQMWAAQFYRFDKPPRASAGAGGLRHRRRLDPDVHPGTVDLQAVRPAGQGGEPEQPVPRHGPAVAADRVRQPLLAVVHGRVARLRPSRRGLRPCRCARGAPGGCRAGAARGVRALQGPAGVPRHRDRPDRERLADGAGRQGAHRDDPGLRGPVRRAR
jgi:acetolactate synthase-1/2/3 large subunit